MDDVLTDESLVLDRGDDILAVLEEYDDVVDVGALAHEGRVVDLLLVDAHEAAFHISVELGVGDNHFLDVDVLEFLYAGQAGMRIAVFLLYVLEVGDGVLGEVLQVVFHLGDLVLGGLEPLVGRLNVEFRNLADRLLHQFQDVVVGDGLAHEMLVFEHLVGDVLYLFLPGAGVVLQHAVYLLFEEYLLQAHPVPVVFQFGQGDAQLFFEKVAGVHRAVTQDVVDGHELRLSVLDDDGVG